ncbi:cytochrome c maturation protein CcmE domain-containing protein [Halorussus salinisoli]|uniref:cytochrome c maturation protein CcmE domain-containing protein n=1 Tax=Halorussus salinisoli TaxID=2558242 RepID=UPI0010C1A7C8|nr:cytochrome c maturation protein CcmE [Halorussus salinisoli]
MRRKTKLVVAAVGMLVLFGVLGTTTMSATTEFVTPTSLDEGDYRGEWVNLEGSVEGLDADGQRATFRVNDGNVSIPVVYEKQLPDTMQNGRIVVAKGVYRDGRLTAKELSVRAHEGEERPDDAG